MENKFIPVCEPLLEGNEEKYVLDALKTGWISSSGKYIKAFEEAFADYLGVKHGIAVCNGTVALHTALVALGIGKGDEVIIPNFTMIASAFSICYTGAIPVFIDAERKTWNIDVDKIEEKITTRTKAIMAVHIYGHPCDMAKIHELAKKYDLKVIEDAAEVHGAEYKGEKCGSLSDVAAFSFFANKIATTGEGGMVVTNDDEIARNCRYYKNLCFSLEGKRSYNHNHIGYNYRMSNLHAAIGLAQIEKMDEYVLKRRMVHSMYVHFMGNLPGISFQGEKFNVKNVYWMNGIVLDNDQIKISTANFAELLFKKGIDTRGFFVGMNHQKSLIDYGCDCQGNYEISDWLTKGGLYLPSSSNLKEEEIKYICENIKEIIQA